MERNVKKMETATILKSLLAVWVMIVFGSSTLLVAFSPLKQIKYSSNLIINFFRQVWEVADEMGPAVKISLIVLFGIFFLFLGKYMTGVNRVAAYFVSISCAVLSVLLVLTLLPLAYSRGFGIGLTGYRFDIQTTPYYIAGAVFGGITFVYTYRMLLTKEKNKTDDGAA